MKDPELYLRSQQPSNEKAAPFFVISLGGRGIQSTPHIIPVLYMPLISTNRLFSNGISEAYNKPRAAIKGEGALGFGA